jgi:hypothetical protein
MASIVKGINVLFIPARASLGISEDTSEHDLRGLLILFRLLVLVFGMTTFFLQLGILASSFMAWDVLVLVPLLGLVSFWFQFSSGDFFF